MTEQKALIEQIIAAHRVQKMRMDMNLDRQKAALHMCFTGTPGTAKTTVARLIAQILARDGVLKTGRFVECGRADLVAKYVGWTAKAVRAKFREARGGVLFIDEAYSLSDGEHATFGEEAINTIVQEMENNRDNVIVIFAGYPDKMKYFLDHNEGLRTRPTNSRKFLSLWRKSAATIFPKMSPPIARKFLSASPRKRISATVALSATFWNRRGLNRRNALSKKMKAAPSQKKI